MAGASGLGLVVMAVVSGWSQWSGSGGDGSGEWLEPCSLSRDLSLQREEGKGQCRELEIHTVFPSLFHAYECISLCCG